MATRSRIGMVRTDGSVISIYCHWDSYISHNGAILLESYQDPKKVEELISLGDISILAPDVNPDPTKGEHSFDHAQEGVVVAYGRDRGEDPDGIKPRIDKTVDEFVVGDVEEYGYLFKDGKWFVVKGWIDAGDKRSLVELTADLIKKDDNGEKWW